MRLFQVLVFGILAGCAADERVAPQFEAEGRTVADAEFEMSCGCPPGHTLYCDGRSGVSEPLTDSCTPLPLHALPEDVPTGFLLSPDTSEVLEKCDFESTSDGVEDTRRRLATIFCVPL